jgi:histidinol-phosphate phosphatase family protein
MTEAAKPVVFFDRDGTLNEDRGYTHRPEDLRWLEGAREAIRLVNRRGYLAVVVTNQAGIGRGYYDEAAMHRFHARMQEELATIGARIDAFYHCPFHPDATVQCYRHADHPDRKPNPGMIVRALTELAADRARALIVGDQDSDLAAGRAAGIVSVQTTGESLEQTVRRALDALDWD